MPGITRSERTRSTLPCRSSQTCRAASPFSASARGPQDAPFLASHARHPQIRKNQIDFAVQVVANLQGGFPILGFGDAVAQLLQTLADITANCGFVFDDQYGLPAGLRVRLAASQ